MLPYLLNYEPPQQSIWQGRKDSMPGECFFQRVTVKDIRTEPLTPHTVIIGFCSDEGIRRNHGRLGAKTGPNAIREQLAKLPCHQQRYYLDIGNIVCDDGNLEQAQQQLGYLIEYCHQNQCKTVVLGGGHEVAWGHFLGLTSSYPMIDIINVDAHFDLRKPQHYHQGTSGTPFWQINEYCQENQRPFHYGCLGIQTHANTQSLFTQANTFKVPWLTAEQIANSELTFQTAFIDDYLLHQEAIYLSICLDVFAQCYAPGVSAPQALGLSPWQVLPLLKYIMQTGKVVSIDMAELSPPLDEHQKTARLAAMIIAELLEFNYYK